MTSPLAGKNWIERFVRFAQPFNTTPLFLEWAAVWQLSTAVTRQCGMISSGQFLTPNLFILLIGGPGSGKSQAISATRQIMLPATHINVIPSSITRAGLQDYMHENMVQRKAADGSVAISNECIALSEEMQGILPEHDIGHLTLYNELYDVRSIYKARTRTHGQIDLQSPYCSIITGAQPAFLGTTLPEQAWGMGFMSRSIMVYDQPRERKNAFEQPELDRNLQQRLILELRAKKDLFGYFQWQPEAIALYKTWWVDKGGPPVPQAKRLAMGYNSRRSVHFFKLSMAYSLARGEDMKVTLEDAKLAISLLLRTEDKMRFVFTEMSNTGAMVAIQDVLDVVRQEAAAGRTVSEAHMIELLQARFPPSQVHALIDNLEKSLMIETVPGLITAKGFRDFKAGKKLLSL